MTWLSLFWPAATVVLIFAGIGGSLAWVVGLRGFFLPAVAPAFAITVIGMAAILAPLVGLRWSVLPVLLLAGLIAAVVLIVRWRTGSLGSLIDRARSSWGWPAVAVAVAGAVIAFRVSQVVGSPEAISQTFDNVFHLNAIRYILDTSDGSSLHLGAMTSPFGGMPFYPGAWHDLASLVVQLTGASIPLVVTAQTFVIAALVWPLGAILLARTLFGTGAIVTLSAGVVATSIAAFPILPMDYGVLYPFQLGLALLPAALAATLVLTGLAQEDAVEGIWWKVLLLAGILPGVALAHPGAFVASLALTSPMVVALAVRSWRTARTRRLRWMLLGGFAVYLTVGAVLVKVLRPPADARGWPVPLSALDALWQIATVSLWYGLPAIAVAIAIIAGIIWAMVRRTPSALVALGMYAVASLLFFVVAAVRVQTIRDALTGSWYNNWPRLAAILAIAMVPLAVYGVAESVRTVCAQRAVRHIVDRAPRGVVTALVLLSAFAALAVEQSGSVAPATQLAHRNFVMGPDSALLSDDEFALLSRLDSHVPEGVMIAGSPYTGVGLAYALTGRPVLMPHILLDITDAMRDINDGLDTATRGDAACRAAEELNLGFVLDFGGREVHGGNNPFPGLDDLADSNAVRLVDQQGDARLYQLVACA